MPDCNDFDEVSVLIPGYSIEDIPSDQNEDAASSLLNAFAVAWHPELLRATRSGPRYRQSEAATSLPSPGILLVPQASESWLPHEWRGVLRARGNMVIGPCNTRDEWLRATASVSSRQHQVPEPAPAAHDGPSAQHERSDLPSDHADPGLSTPALCDAATPILVDHFLALGTCQFLVMLLSRRMHHFTDPDFQLLDRESRLAAAAACAGDEESTRRHLTRCFEQLRETRERFYPLEAFLLDLCLPPADVSAAELIGLLRTATKVTLIVTGQMLDRCGSESPDFAELLQQRVAAGELSFLSGHQWELRPTIGSMAAVLSDMRTAERSAVRWLGQGFRHWSRRRFGLQSVTPGVLRHCGFDFALHVALDDGVYPDRERSHFEWQSPDGSKIPACSRIPLAIDSATSFLRFPDRCAESMQDDSPSILLLARLPSVRSPWLSDLRIAAEYAGVLGEFVTCDRIARTTGMHYPAQKFAAWEYLSPTLIQSSVLKTEPPVTGPARLHRLRLQLESLHSLCAMLAVLQDDTSATLPERRQLETDLALTELAQSAATEPESDCTPALRDRYQDIQTRLDTLGQTLAQRFLARVPQDAATVRGRLLVNPLPFRRICQTEWPAEWQPPASHAALEAWVRTDSGRAAIVQVPPCGFAWLTEADTPSAAQAEFSVKRREPPLAEAMVLRNRVFEVELSDVTGGIASVVFHGKRLNRVSQQAAFRFERDQTVTRTSDDGTEELKTPWAVSRFLSSKVIQSGPVEGEIETAMELLSPVDQRRLAVCHQRTRVHRWTPYVTIDLAITDVARAVVGNPWLTYFACRFAWNNEAATVSRSVLGQAAGICSERFESPDYVEIADEQSRLTIVSHGRPWYRTSGPRLLDALMIVEGESARAFRFVLAFDEPCPLQVSTEMLTAPVVVDTRNACPAKLSSGWVLGVPGRNISLVHAEPLGPPAVVQGNAEIGSSSERQTDTGIDTQAGAGRGWVVRFDLLETEGAAVDGLLRLARKPLSARQIGPGPAECRSLAMHAEGVALRFRPFELKTVEVEFPAPNS